MPLVWQPGWMRIERLPLAPLFFDTFSSVRTNISRSRWAFRTRARSTAMTVFRLVFSRPDATPSRFTPDRTTTCGTQPPRSKHGRPRMAMLWDASDDETRWGARIESYLTDPATEPDPEKWQTE